MICPKCGAKLEDGIRICPVCGKNLTATSVGTVFKRRDLQDYDELSLGNDIDDTNEYDEDDYDDNYTDDGYVDDDDNEDDYYEEDDEEMNESQGGKHILKVNRLDNSRFSSNLDHDDNEDYYSSANAAYFASEKDDRHKKKKSKVNGVIVGLIVIC